MEIKKVKEGLQRCIKPDSSILQVNSKCFRCPYSPQCEEGEYTMLKADALKAIENLEKAIEEKQKHLENLQKVNEDLEERIAIMEEGTDNGWIPVTLGLPEPDDSPFGITIIVCNKYMQVFSLRYARRNIRGKVVDRWQWDDGRIYYGEIIAWKYLPEPPKVGDE